MTFEEEFCDKFEHLLNFNQIILINDIKHRHCLDKARVKAAIDKIFDIEDHEDKVHNERIKKELGLE